MQKMPKPKTEAEIKREMIAKQETNRLRVLIKEVIYPALIEKSESIEDAKMVCTVISTTIGQAVLNFQKDLKVSSLDIPQVSDEKYKRFNEIVDLLKEENVNDAQQLMRGVSDVIDSFIREENNKRPLSELNAELLDPTPIQDEK